MATPAKWQSEFLVNTFTAGVQNSPSVTALADGRFAMSWSDTGDVRARIFHADGTAADPEFLVNTTTHLGQDLPEITGLADGGFAISWRDWSAEGPGDASSDAIRAQVFTHAGAKSGGEFLVNTTTFSAQEYQSITTLADGRFVVTWEDLSKTGLDISGDAIRGQVFNANGSKSGDEFLVNTTTIGNQIQPSVEALSDGGFVVVWDDKSQSGIDTVGYGVKAQRFDVDGDKAGNEFQVNTRTASDQWQNDVASLTDDRFVVVWEDLSGGAGDDSGRAIRAQIFDDAGKVGGEILVNTTTAGNQFTPVVTGLSDGRFFVVWTDNSQTGGDTSSFAIRAQLFDADGNKDGDEILVNTTTENGQGGPKVDELADGRIVVTWHDSSEDTPGVSNTVVRAQIFDPREAAITLAGTALADDFVGTKWNDVLDGGALGDTLAGAKGADTLDGGAGKDVLSGGAGDDQIDGGKASDTLLGGTGSDTFQYDTLTESTVGANRDRIHGFVSGEDHVDLATLDADATAAGNQAFAFLGAGSFTGAAGQLRYNGSVLQGDVNGDGAADFQIQIYGAPTLAAADLVL